jgi:hypothetical protein
MLDEAAGSRLIRRGEPHDFAAAVVEVGNELMIDGCIDHAAVREFAREQGAVIAPTCAALGGVVAHEAVKAFARCFRPLSQFFTFASVEPVPLKCPYRPIGDRYDPYRHGFGNDAQTEQQRLEYLLIGLGAVGCEQLEIWAVMGVGSIKIADP